MAIYVSLSDTDVSNLLDHYDCGKLIRFEGIERGVSNSNFHVFTDKGRYILTLFEPRRMKIDDLPFFLEWADHLNKNGITCPAGIPDKDGRIIHSMKERAAVLIEYLEGEDIPRGTTTAKHCGEMGAFTARLHNATQGFKYSREDEWGLLRYSRFIDAHLSQIDTLENGLSNLLKEELDYLRKNGAADLSRTLPAGVVHTDLFPDNVFFIDDKISAVIDIYFACNHAFIYDLAIIINAWCFDSSQTWQEENFKALIKGYTGERTLDEQERIALNLACRLSCLRFFVSRAEELFSYDPAHVTMKPHDPLEFIARLKYWQTHTILDT